MDGVKQSKKFVSMFEDFQDDLDVNNQMIIRCPHCGYEYLPSEIFMSEYLLGKPEHILRDPIGHILHFDYRKGFEPVTTESFICEHCDKQFEVEVTMNFKSSAVAKELDFSETSVGLLDD